MFSLRCIISKWNTIYDESSMMIDWFINLLYPNATFSNISAISWRPVLVVEEAGVPREKTPTMGNKLVNLITCGCEWSAPFFVNYKSSPESTAHWGKPCMSCYVIELPSSLSHSGPFIHDELIQYSWYIDRRLHHPIRKTG